LGLWREDLGEEVAHPVFAVMGWTSMTVGWRLLVPWIGDVGVAVGLGEIA